MTALRRWPWFVAILALVAAGFTVIAVRADERPTVRWDRRVVPLVRFVERERGLRFHHAVATHFLADEAFLAEVDSGDAEQDGDELRHLEGVLRALGVAEGELDLRASSDRLRSDQVIGLYDVERDRILVRGRRITDAMRPTIVHELTHALQAQHFDLDRTARTSGEDVAFTSLVEADAMRIEDAYVASLSPSRREALHEAATQADVPDADEDVPVILSELFSLPYVLGPRFLDALVADGGEAAVTGAFRRPPTTEEHIADPTSYLRDDAPAPVGTPPLRRGERQVGDADDFGMISLLLVLGERVPFAQAWTAVEGWEGDASVTYRARGRDCIRIHVRFDRPVDRREFLDAARRWTDGRPAASARATGGIVALQSCDPGSKVTTAGPGRPRPFDLLQLRIELLASLESGDLDHAEATCVADAVLRDHDPAVLLSVATVQDPNDPRLVTLQRDVAAATADCRRP